MRLASIMCEGVVSGMHMYELKSMSGLCAYVAWLWVSAAGLVLVALHCFPRLMRCPCLRLPHC